MGVFISDLEMMNSDVKEIVAILSFSLPLLDWDYSKHKKLRAEVNLSMAKSEIEQQDMQLEQEITFHVSCLNLRQKNIASSIEAKQIAEENYELKI